MLSRLRAMGQRLARKGFAGPHYTGISGKVRFLVESTIARRELVFVLTPESFSSVIPPVYPGFSLYTVERFEELEVYRADLERAWYPGLIEGWRGPWSWGERLYLALHEGKPIGFNWLQVGSIRGAPCSWGRVLEHEYRILRGGVAPSQRGRGTNTVMKHAIIKALFEGGATRVWAECYERNVPSVRTLRALGFRAIGRLQVLEVPGLRGFIRWSPLPEWDQEPALPSSTDG